MRSVELIVAAIREGKLSTRDLVLINYALAERGKNTTSVLGQHGEELVAAAYKEAIGSFDQKGYDVVTATGEHLPTGQDLHLGPSPGGDSVVRLRRDHC